MSLGQWTTKAAADLKQLCQHASRRVGTPGNLAATEWFASVLATCGFATGRPSFECLDWVDGGATLTVGRAGYSVQVSPFSLGGRFRAPLAVVTSVPELEQADLRGRIVLLRGEIAKEQLMPKNFPFYNPEEHQHLYSLLEARAPLAIIAATARNPELAGALYPFPLFEDGDFDIPSVFLTDVEGQRLALEFGQTATLSITAERLPAVAANVVGQRVTPGHPQVVFCAHIDAKHGTPGALDDGAGIVTLRLLAEMLTDYHGALGVEIVAMNGEDYYGAPGEQLYLRHNQGRWDEIALCVNLDGLGYVRGGTAYSFYECSDTVSGLCRRVLEGYPGLVEGVQWYQGDHSMFVQQGCSAMAITSENMAELWTEIAHTPRDAPEIVDPARLVTTAHALHELLWELNRSNIHTEGTDAKR